MIETQFSKPIKVFRSNNAQEYKAHEFTSILHQFSIVPHSSCADTSQQNGKAEHKLRHIFFMLLVLLLLPLLLLLSFGGKLLLLPFTPSIYVLLPLFKIKLLMICCLVLPSYDLLRVFGCVCFVLLQDHERNKLQSRSRLCCFLGYEIGQNGYRCYDIISKRLRVSRHVVFWEHKMFYQLPHVPVSPIPSIDPLPDLFLEESLTSLSKSPPSITDVPSHASD